MEKCRVCGKEVDTLWFFAHVPACYHDKSMELGTTPMCTCPKHKGRAPHVDEPIQYAPQFMKFEPEKFETTNNNNNNNTPNQPKKRPLPTNKTLHTTTTTSMSLDDDEDDMDDAVPKRHKVEEELVSLSTAVGREVLYVGRYELSLSEWPPNAFDSHRYQKEFADM